MLCRREAAIDRCAVSITVSRYLASHRHSDDRFGELTVADHSPLCHLYTIPPFHAQRAFPHGCPPGRAGLPTAQTFVSPAV